MEGMSERSWRPHPLLPQEARSSSSFCRGSSSHLPPGGPALVPAVVARACGKRGTTSAGLISIKYELMASSGPGTVLAAGDTGMNTVGVAPQETRHPAHTYSHHQNRPRWKQSSASFNNNGHSGNRKGCHLLSPSSLPGTEHFTYVNSF